jgi:Cu-Zn family superoxide dismutase
MRLRTGLASLVLSVAVAGGLALAHAQHAHGPGHAHDPMMSVRGVETAPGTAVPAPMVVSFPVIGNLGQRLGTATLTQAPTGVLMRVELGRGALTPGWHGLHFHGVGDCSDNEGFMKSGSHAGMVAGGHGLLNPLGPEAGDLPNIYAGPDGSAGAEVFTEAVSLAQGDRALMDADGSALIIHANPDDHFSQPIGGAGKRVACAAVR